MRFPGEKCIPDCFKEISSWLVSFLNRLNLYLFTTKDGMCYIDFIYTTVLCMMGNYLGEYLIFKKGPKGKKKKKKEEKKEGRKEGRTNKRERGREERSKGGREEKGKVEKKETLIPLMFSDSKFSIFRKCAQHFFP